MMLKIAPTQIDAMRQSKIDALGPKIDLWLSDTLPDWARRSDADRSACLDRLIDVAESASMRVETDYALFIRIVVEAEAEDEDFLARSDVSDVLDDGDYSAQAKILRLNALSSEPREEESDDGY